MQDPASSGGHPESGPKRIRKKLTKRDRENLLRVAIKALTHQPDDLYLIAGAVMKYSAQLGEPLAEEISRGQATKIVARAREYLRIQQDLGAKDYPAKVKRRVDEFWALNWTKANDVREKNAHRWSANCAKVLPVMQDLAQSALESSGEDQPTQIEYSVFDPGNGNNADGTQRGDQPAGSPPAGQ